MTISVLELFNGKRRTNNKIADWETIASLTTLRTVDSVKVDDFERAHWDVVAILESDPTRKYFFVVTASHNGHSGADATSIRKTEHTSQRFGAAFNLSVSVDLNGSGTAQEMRLRMSSTTAGITIKYRLQGVPA